MLLPLNFEYIYIYSSNLDRSNTFIYSFKSFEKLPSHFKSDLVKD